MNECRENNVGSLGKDTRFPAAKGLSNEEETSDLMLRENGALRSPGSEMNVWNLTHSNQPLGDLSRAFSYGCGSQPGLRR